MLVTTTPAAAAPAWTPAFGLADRTSGRPAITPDGTVVFPVGMGVQIRPPGGPIGDSQLLGGYPVVAGGGDGRVVAAWIEGGDVRVATLMPGASSFGPSAPLPPLAATPQLAMLDVDAAGNATVLWSNVDDAGGGTTVAQMRATTIPADGSAPSTVLLDELPGAVGTTVS